MEQASHPLHLFEGYGIELEYMIVDREHLTILPLADRVLYSITGAYEPEVGTGKLCWSNELVLHVIELKTNGPARELESLPDTFNNDIRRINAILSPHGAQLMPTGLHPWVNPHTHTKLWPHEYNVIYETYKNIFGCQDHGWSNIQSSHINLPFYDDSEFARLHTAIRLVLPLLPALAASTPVIEGKLSSVLDSRLKVYCTNQQKIPSIAGDIIPERVLSRREYERVILEKMYRDTAPYDPEGIIRHEWLNSRGAIARFERNTIETRVLDMQECPLADLSIAFLTIEIVKALVREQWTDYLHQCSFGSGPLVDLFHRTVSDAEQALIDDPHYLEVFNYPSSAPCKADGLLHYLSETLVPDSSPWCDPLAKLLSQGSLARRIIKSLKGDTRLEHLREIYGELCKCLARGKFFSA